jgi:ribonuclease HI
MLHNPNATGNIAK